jgi:hypothetical protein
MKTIEISVAVTPSFVQLFNYKNPRIAAQAVDEWLKVANVGDEITVKVAERDGGEEG